jgi:tRNA guanosine-2'-O-methyltransferase
MDVSCLHLLSDPLSSAANHISVSLDKYEFPEKSVLVLGHEKEGMPVALIQLLDVCLEIPQFGVTRSLNVHVSGALCIYEYAKQHVFHCD